jgi:6-phosphogluconolactonase
MRKHHRLHELVVAPLLLVLSLDAAAGQVPAKPAPGSLLVYTGTYTGGKSEGIYVFRFDTATGKATAPELAAKSENPSFLALHPGKRFLYAVNEVGQFEGQSSGAVSAFSIDGETGKLTFLNQKSSGGAGPCHVSVDRSGKTVFAANYTGGSAIALRVEEDGRLGAATATLKPEEEPAAGQKKVQAKGHWMDIDPKNQFALVAFLGLERLSTYRFDAAKGTLTPNDPPFASLRPGSGPRHAVFHPGGRFVYVINETSCTMTAFSFDGAKGALKELGTVSTLPVERQQGWSTAEVQVHPSGKFLYGSNRGHDSIAVFGIDPVAGTIKTVEHQPTGGKTPRSFGIDPTGSWLLAVNQASDTIVVFRIDPATGHLKRTDEAIQVGAPVCVVFLAGK